MARVTKEMTMGELFQTYYEKCPEIVDVLTGLGNASSDAQALSENYLQMLHMFTGIDSDLCWLELNATINAKLGE